MKKPIGNIYDKIFKENAPSIFKPILESRLGSKIVRYKPLSIKIQSTFEREVDFLFDVNLKNGEAFLLHLEFQTHLPSNMVYRMSEYHGFFLRKYKKSIKHFVIFIGTGKAGINQQLPTNQIFTSFDVIALNQLNASDLLSSQIPEEIILAILGK